MNADIIKRAPKWAWLTAAGVGGGVVLLKFWKGRAVDPATTNDATTVDQGSVSTTAPSPVITPPVIISGGQGDNGALADLVSAFTGTFASSLDNAVNTIGGLAQGDQALAGQAIGGVITQSGQITDLSGRITDLLANAGSAPAPANQNPTPIIVQVPAGGGVSAPAPTAPKADPCTGEYPYQSARGCYKVVLTHGDRYHYYKDGTKLKV